ncbi:hypothetical protein NPIL_192741 [Nephila pilipes]|uniref:Uncharacterized protein n=1 Tax=Nephila pilipes TaxID=299642 RepID=A0A8X6M6H8_NEPPI|nr:hypothetical protein NPIL_192741 [Nephila pilipes]
MMDAQANWSDRTDEVMEQSIEQNLPNNNSDQGAALPASPSSKIYSEEFFAVNFMMTRRAIQGRNAYAAWARKLGTTKKDDPEFLRVHEELRKSGENLDKVLTQMGDIPLFKLPASEKELDQLVENFNNPAKRQEETVPKVSIAPLRQDRPESASQAKKSTKRVRDSEGFISPPKHLTRKAPKANQNDQIATTVNLDANPDVDINTLDPVVAETPPKSSAKQPIRKQPPPPPRPDISGYRKVEPTLQYAAALQGGTTERPRATLPPPPRATGDARFNAGMLKDLFEMIADTSVNKDALVRAIRISLPALRAASTDIDRSYIIFEAYCGLL